jgi:hypothetical protein
MATKSTKIIYKFIILWFGSIWTQYTLISTVWQILQNAVYSTMTYKCAHITNESQKQYWLKNLWDTFGNEVFSFNPFYLHFVSGTCWDRFCGPVVRVPGHRYRWSGFDSPRYHIFWEIVSLERCPLRLVNLTEELLELKSSGSGSRKPRLTALGIRCADHATPYIQKSWH